MASRILSALSAALVIGSVSVVMAKDNYSAGAVREAAGLAPAYEFARQCAMRGEISRAALSDYRNRLLAAIEEKYTLDFDQVRLAEEYLIGEASVSMPLIYPSSRSDDTGNCATATNLM